jgi:hypothetical protein
MKLPLRPDPDAALQAAQAALVQAEARIDQLQTERSAKIEADGDYIADVAKIDVEITRLQASLSAHHDRITILQRRQRDGEHANRMQQKVACIAEVKKAVPRRQAAVERVDGLVKQLANAVAELEAADEAVFANWPAIMPPAHRFGYLRAMRIEPLSNMRKQRTTAGVVRELVSRVPFEFATEIAKRSRELIEELESTPVPELSDIGAAA